MSEIRVDKISEKTADAGITLKSQGTADNKPMVLTLQTAETDMAANDVIGKIAFQAPDEGTGTDAILVAAAIQARSEGDFSSSANATAIDFMVGASEAAATKMSLSSGGILTAVELDISGNIDVDGTTNLDVVDIDGAVNMATTALVTGVLTTTAATVFNGGFTANDGSIITTADNTDTLSLISTDADENSGPNLRLYRNSSSPANDGILGVISFEGENDAGQTVEYARIKNLAADVADGAEEGQIFIDLIKDGTMRRMLTMTGTATVFNEDSVDRDFRIESNALTHAFFIDGGTDHVSIGNSSTSLYTLDIKQNSSFTGSNSDTANEAPLRVTSTHSNGRGAIAIGGNSNNGVFNKGANDLAIQGFNSLTFDVSTTNDDKFGTKTERFRIGSAGTLSTGAETAPDVGAGGLTLQQNAIDTNILTLKSSDVDHGMTSLEQTDSYGIFKKNAANDGGLRIISTSGGAIAFKHEAFATGSNTAESSSATSGWAVDVRKKNGNSVHGMADDDNIASFRQTDQSQLIIKGNGELFSNSTGTVSTFDAYEDAQLVRAFDLSHMRGVINSNFDKFVQYNKDDLQKAKLIGTDEEGNATPMVNITGMQRLHYGAIWQQYEKHQRLAEAVYEMAKETLGADKADAILKKHDIKLLN